MTINHHPMVNRGGRRVILWWVLALNCGIMVVVPFLSAAVFSLVMVRDLRFAWAGAAAGMIIAVLTVLRIFKKPVDQLPLDA